jgi:glycosyltransferase involved in cell wall biosynthesis
MKWSIGMPSYDNFTEVYFTVQSLRMHHDMSDKEIIIVDNYGDDNLARFVKETGGNTVRYERFNENQGVSVAKNKIFELARGEFVLCMDSHILLKPGCFDRDPPGDDMIQGPLLKNDQSGYWCEWLPKWRRHMWGIWGALKKESELPVEPLEIWAMGAGFFAVRRNSWLGFNPAFRGFGGESGYIQEKYRKAGRRVWCYPNMIWLHFFGELGRKITFEVSTIRRVMNYIIGFRELGLPLDEMRRHFGYTLFNKALANVLS